MHDASREDRLFLAVCNYLRPLLLLAEAVRDDESADILVARYRAAEDAFPKFLSTFNSIAAEREAAASKETKHA